MPNNESPRPGQREGHAKPLPTPAPLCSHIMPSGATCGSPAISGTALCYHHSAIKTALGKQTGPSIPFVFPEDRASLQVNYFLLLQAFTEGRIDLRAFNSMQRLLRSMAANLGKKPLAEGQADTEDQVNTTKTPVTTDPSEKETKKPAATANAASRERSGEDKPLPSHPKPVAQNPAQPKPFPTCAFPSFEEIAAQYKPLQSECFLIAPARHPDKHPARFADILTR